jgi:predicted SAM-dependent methyltransferase
MLKAIHDKLIRLISWLERNRQIQPDQAVAKVNLGAGLMVAPGWYNIDGHLRAFFSTWPGFVIDLLYRVIQTSNQQFSKEEYRRILQSNRFIHHDLTYGIPFKNGTVDFLYASHLLEHLHRDEAERLVRDGLRALKSGGVFRICVPDLGYAVSLYQKGEKRRSLQYFFNEQKQDGYTYHRYLYDEELLSALFMDCGFSRVRKCAFREGTTPDVGVLDNRPEETLYMEAVK